MIPDIDSQIGISLYTTKFSGIGGKIRIHPEDFEVSELISKRATNSITTESGYAVYKLKKKKILICVPYGEQHIFGTKVLESQLSSAGNTVYNLSPFTPISSIMESIEYNNPDCIFVSITLDENILSAKRMIQKINDQYVIPIIVGGQAVKNDSENWNASIGQNLSITKILKLIQSKKSEIIQIV